MIDRVELERSVVSMAVEDMHGLYEIVWTLNGMYPDAPKAVKVDASKLVLGRLVELGQVVVHWLEWHPARDLGVVPSSEIENVLSEPSSWEPGPTYIGFVATEAGEARYFGHSQS